MAYNLREEHGYLWSLAVSYEAALDLMSISLSMCIMSLRPPVEHHALPAHAEVFWEGSGVPAAAVRAGEQVYGG